MKEHGCTHTKMCASTVLVRGGGKEWGVAQEINVVWACLLSVVNRGTCQNSSSAKSSMTREHSAAEVYDHRRHLQGWVNTEKVSKLDVHRDYADS